MKILNTDLSNYKAIIFDLDGTLVDSMPLHNKLWLETFNEYGANVSIDLLNETAGIESTRLITLINEQQGLSLSPKEVTKTKNDKYKERISEVKTFDPILDIAKYFFKKIPLGIITGGDREIVEVLLSKLDLNKYFDVVICGDDTENGKDTAKPYELMSEKIGVSTDKALFLDDGDMGLKGAKLSGMDVIHVDIHNPKVFLSKN